MPAARVTDSGLRTPGFRLWLGAATVSATGDGVLYFALAWTASGLGPGVATAVMVAGLLPEVLLTLVGGAAADRWGARRTLVGCTVAMSALLVGFLLALEAGTPVALALVAISAAAGVVASFHLPASNVLPRLFFDDDTVARGMAVTGSVLQVARIAGPPVGALVVATFALEGALAVDLVSFAAVLVVLLVVRPPREEPPAAPTGSALADVRRGLTAIRDVPGVVPLLGSLSLVAGGLLPLLSLGVPLLARERGWEAQDAGVIEACWIVGTLVVTLVVTRWGTRLRALPPMVAGPVLAGAGVAALALAPTPLAGCAAAIVMGVGTAVYTTHVFPLYVLRSPADMLARFQSVLVLVQTVVMLLGNVLLGSAIAHLGAVPAFVLAAVVCALAAVPVAASPVLRLAETR